MLKEEKKERENGKQKKTEIRGERKNKKWENENCIDGIIGEDNEKESSGRWKDFVEQLSI
jgi:hypothetical protein